MFGERVAGSVNEDGGSEGAAGGLGKEVASDVGEEDAAEVRDFAGGEGEEAGGETLSRTQVAPHERRRYRILRSHHKHFHLDWEQLHLQRTRGTAEGRRGTDLMERAANSGEVLGG